MDEFISPEHVERIGLAESTPRKYLRPLVPQRRGGLVVHEIYGSIQGESTLAGRPCCFVRLAGCHLRCHYCDTPHAFGQGQWMSTADVLARVDDLGLGLVELTGGEPMLQSAVLPLMTELCERGYEVMIETSGSLDIRCIDPRVRRIVDLKTPSSGEAGANRLENLTELGPRDEVKFVVGNQADYLWARDVLERHRISERCPVLFGCVHGELRPRTLAEWIVSDRLPVRFQLQLHKVLWDPAARGV